MGISSSKPPHDTSQQPNSAFKKGDMSPAEESTSKQITNETNTGNPQPTEYITNNLSLKEIHQKSGSSICDKFIEQTKYWILSDWRDQIILLTKEMNDLSDRGFCWSHFHPSLLTFPTNNEHLFHLSQQNSTSLVIKDNCIVFDYQHPVLLPVSPIIDDSSSSEKHWRVPMLVLGSAERNLNTFGVDSTHVKGSDLTDVYITGWKNRFYNMFSFADFKKKSSTWSDEKQWLLFMNAKYRRASVVTVWLEFLWWIYQHNPDKQIILMMNDMSTSIELTDMNIPVDQSTLLKWQCEFYDADTNTSSMSVFSSIFRDTHTSQMSFGDVLSFVDSLDLDSEERNNIIHEMEALHFTKRIQVAKLLLERWITSHPSIEFRRSTETDISMTFVPERYDKESGLVFGKLSTHLTNAIDRTEGSGTLSVDRADWRSGTVGSNSAEPHLNTTRGSVRANSLNTSSVEQTTKWVGKLCIDKLNGDESSVEKPIPPYEYPVYSDFCLFRNDKMVSPIKIIVMKQLMPWTSPFTESDVKETACELITQLEKIHATNMVHMDIKIENIMLCDKKHVFIDFDDMCKIGRFGRPVFTRHACAIHPDMTDMIINGRQPVVLTVPFVDLLELAHVFLAASQTNPKNTSRWKSKDYYRLHRYEASEWTFVDSIIKQVLNVPASKQVSPDIYQKLISICKAIEPITKHQLLV